MIGWRTICLFDEIKASFLDRLATTYLFHQALAALTLSKRPDLPLNSVRAKVAVTSVNRGLYPRATTLANEMSMPSQAARSKRLLHAAIERLRRLPADRRGYLDPGSGSYILQVAMAGLLGAAFAIKSSWLNIKTTIRAKLGKRK